MGLTRNAKLGITLVSFCPISEEWGKLEILNLARMFFSEMLLNPTKCQGYNF